MGYLTPDSVPADTTCRVLVIPNNQEFIANVLGAIQALTFPENWDKWGVLTPEEAAEALVPMFDTLCFNEGVCRVIGEIITSAGTVSPDPVKWLVCDGTSLLRADYPDLFAVIGTVYGAADGSHFNIPDYQGRTIGGSGTGSGLTPRAVGDQYGEENHVLTVGELAIHSHNDAGHTHVEGNAAPTVGAAITGVPVPSAVPAVGTTGLGYAAISNTGNDDGHNTIGPRNTALFLIVALQ